MKRSVVHTARRQLRARRFDVGFAEISVCHAPGVR
jgi:hypothetical protein